MIRWFRQSRAAQVAGVLAIAVVYSVVGTGSHIHQGHQEPITTISQDFQTADLPMRILLGGLIGPETVSFFPSNGVDAGPAIDAAISNWNSHLRNNGPSSLAFDVLTRASDSDSNANIKVTVFDPPVPPGQQDCGGSTACTQVEVDDDRVGHVYLNRDRWPSPSSHRNYILTHELGHAFGALNDHYNSSLGCVSVMGLGFYDGCPLTVQAHDNDDIYQIFRQNTQQVERLYFQEFNPEPSGMHYRLGWDPTGVVPQEERQHGESNFVILYSNNVYSGFSDWSGASRNRRFQDGYGCCLDVLGLAEAGPWFGVHSCFRIRPVNIVFGPSRPERFGIQTNAVCIVRSSATNPNVVTRTHRGNNGPQDGIFVDVTNQTSSSLAVTGLEIRSQGGGPICILGQTTVAPGQTTSCWFPSSGQRSFVEVWYYGGLQSFVGFDSSLLN